MKKMAYSGGLSKPDTNHCIRKTTVTASANEGFKAKDIMCVTGHRNVTSLEPYLGCLSMKRKKNMLDALSNYGKTTTKPSATVTSPCDPASCIIKAWYMQSCPANTAHDSNTTSYTSTTSIQHAATAKATHVPSCRGTASASILCVSGQHSNTANASLPHFTAKAAPAKSCSTCTCSQKQMSATHTFTPTSTSLSPHANTRSDVEREQYGIDYFMTQEFTAQPLKESVLVETETQSQTSVHQVGKRTFQFKKRSASAIVSCQPCPTQCCEEEPSGSAGASVSCVALANNEPADQCASNKEPASSSSIEQQITEEKSATTSMWLMQQSSGSLFAGAVLNNCVFNIMFSK